MNFHISAKGTGIGMNSTTIINIYVCERNDLILSRLSLDSLLIESIELTSHPWFVVVQHHPEFKSRPNKTHPLFREFIRAAVLLAGSEL